MKKNNKTKQVRISAELHRLLKMEAFREGMTIAALVNAMLGVHITEMKKLNIK